MHVTSGPSPEDARHKIEKKHQKNKIETKPIVILDTILAIKLSDGITDKAAPQGK